MKTIEEAALAWYARKLAHRAAKQAWRDHWTKGPHAWEADEPGEGGGGSATCYRQELQFEDWCDHCKAGEALYQTRKRASLDVSGAMNTLQRACGRKLTAEGGAL